MQETELMSEAALRALLATLRYHGRHEARATTDPAYIGHHRYIGRHRPGRTS